MQNERVEVIVFGQHCLNTLGQIRSLRELGLSPDVVWVNGDDHSPRGSRNIRHFFAFDTVEEGFSFIRRHYCDDAVRYIILTDSDAVVSLLNRHYDALRPRFSFFNAGENGRLSEFMPKWTQCQLAERSGMRVPRSELVKKGDLPRALTYPIFTKSPDSLGRSWKKNALICRNQDMCEQTPEIKLIPFARMREVFLLGKEMNAASRHDESPRLSIHCRGGQSGHLKNVLRPVSWLLANNAQLMHSKTPCIRCSSGKTPVHSSEGHDDDKFHVSSCPCILFISHTSEKAASEAQCEHEQAQLFADTAGIHHIPVLFF